MTPYTFVPSDKRVFDPAKARIARPKTEAERVELLRCDDPDDIEKEFGKSLSSTRPKNGDM